LSLCNTTSTQTNKRTALKTIVAILIISLNYLGITHISWEIVLLFILLLIINGLSDALLRRDAASVEYVKKLTQRVFDLEDKVEELEDKTR